MYVTEQVQEVISIYIPWRIGDTLKWPYPTPIISRSLVYTMVSWISYVGVHMIQSKPSLMLLIWWEVPINEITTVYFYLQILSPDECTYKETGRRGMRWYQINELTTVKLSSLRHGGTCKQTGRRGVTLMCWSDERQPRLMYLYIRQITTETLRYLYSNLVLRSI